jgi:hypothetical protein
MKVGEGETSTMKKSYLGRNGEVRDLALDIKIQKTEHNS